MSKYFIFFLMFSFFALSAVGFSVYDSSFFKTDNSSAEGFGISPPYFQNDNLKPGDSYSKTIGIMRSEAKTAAKAEVNIVADEIASWLIIKPGLLVNLNIGDFNTPLNITANIPINAKPGVYKGFIYLEMINDENNSGVGIRVGARIDIKLIVNGNEKLTEEIPEEKNFEIKNDLLYGQLKGKFIIKSTNTDEAYYISLDKKQAYYLGGSTSITAVINDQGRGISEKNLEKIPVNLSGLIGPDSDADGLPDNLEISLGTDEKSADTDSDSFNDFYEISNGYSPLLKSRGLPIDLKFAQSVGGRIFLQVENKGQTWYVNLENYQRYFLPTPADALSVIKNLAVSVSEKDFEILKSL
jgi:hypothetical protein